MWPFPDFPAKQSTPSTLQPANSGTTVVLDELIQSRHGIRAVGAGAKKSVQSLLAGSERSPFKGRGIDFDEVRRYQSGDDVRHMDWRVTARSGAPHLKIFREERERPVFLVVDYTNSMLFGTKVAFKSVVAAKSASIIAWASHHRGDRVGAVVFSDQGHEEIRPRGGQSGVLRVLNILTTHHRQIIPMNPTVDAPGRSAFLSALERVKRTARPGSLIFILSDFRSLEAPAIPYVTQLGGHHDVVAVLIYDQLEQEPPAPGMYRITNGKEHGILNARSSALAEAYRHHFQERRQLVESLCRRCDMGFFMVGTHEPVEEKILQGMRNIEARRKHIRARIKENNVN